MTTPLSTRMILALGLGCGVLGAIAGVLGAGWRSEALVRQALLTHPEMLREAGEALRLRDNQAALAGIRSEVERAWPGAVLGNPAGKVTLVEFTDYACTYCRQSLGDVDALIKSNPDLKVVLRELPILSPASTDAAKMALAAAGQGHYAAFHQAMFASGPPDGPAIAAAARAAGLDGDAARTAIAQPGIEAEIARNLALARQLGFSGTPGWVVGDRVLNGAVGVDTLGEAIAAARK